MQTVSPPLNQFLAEIGSGIAMAQVWVAPKDRGFELRHVADRELATEQLLLTTASEARTKVQFNSEGVFRPLRCSPDLIRGWRLVTADPTELEFALNQIYPGALADHYAASQSSASITHYREFTSRQTGMYRSTAGLSDSQVASVTKACCAPRFCLKQRLWTLDGLEADNQESKSLIPCLEPCPVLLEFARKSGRIDQEPPVTLTLRPEQVESLRSALELALSKPPATDRQADVANPRNPRRLQQLLDQLPSTPPPSPKHE